MKDEVGGRRGLNHEAHEEHEEHRGEAGDGEVRRMNYEG